MLLYLIVHISPMWDYWWEFYSIPLLFYCFVPAANWTHPSWSWRWCGRSHWEHWSHWRFSVSWRAERLGVNFLSDLLWTNSPYLTTHQKKKSTLTTNTSRWFRTTVTQLVSVSLWARFPSCDSGSALRSPYSGGASANLFHPETTEIGSTPLLWRDFAPLWPWMQGKRWVNTRFILGHIVFWNKELLWGWEWWRGQMVGAPTPIIVFEFQSSPNLTCLIIVVHLTTKNKNRPITASSRWGRGSVQPLTGFTAMNWGKGEC